MEDSVLENNYRPKRRALSLAKIRRATMLIFTITAAIIFIGAYFAALTR